MLKNFVFDDKSCFSWYNLKQEGGVIILSVANKIKGLIKTSGLKGYEVAERLGMTDQAFRNKLNRDSFYAEDLIKIADCLDLEIAFTGNGQKTVLDMKDIEHR